METHEMITYFDHGRHYVNVTLTGGAVVMINLAERSLCKKCGQRIFWGATKHAKSIPVCQDENGNWTSHFGICPRSKLFRGKNGGDALDEVNRQRTRDRW